MLGTILLIILILVLLSGAFPVHRSFGWGGTSPIIVIVVILLILLLLGH